MLQVNRSLLEVYCSHIPDQEQGVYSSWIDESYATEVEGQSAPHWSSRLTFNLVVSQRNCKGRHV